MTQADVLRWIGEAPPDALPRVEEACRQRREELDVCEHGVQCGGWCMACAVEAKQSRQEAYGEE